MGFVIPPGGQNQDQGHDEDEEKQECRQPCDDADQLCLPAGLRHLPWALAQSKGEGTALTSIPSAPYRSHALSVPFSRPHSR